MVRLQDILNLSGKFEDFKSSDGMCKDVKFGLMFIWKGCVAFSLREASIHANCALTRTPIKKFLSKI